MNTKNAGVIETVKDKSVTAIKGTEKIAKTTVDAAGQLLGTAVKDTAKVGGKVETAVTGLAGGAVEGAKELAVGAEHATAAVAGGAVKAVGEVGSAVVDTIHKPATKPTHADKPVSKEPTKAVSQN